MKCVRKTIVNLLERLAVMLLIGTAAIFTAAQRLESKRHED